MFHFFTDLFLGSRDDAYARYAHFTGMKGAINCVLFNQDGRLLACGGDDEVVRVWDTATKKQKQHLQDHGGRWGQVTCLAWLVGLESMDGLTPLSFGTGRGLVVIYRQTRENSPMVELSMTPVFEPSDPVEAMEYDSDKSRLAVSSLHGRVSVYEVGRNGTIAMLWNGFVDSNKNACIARSIRFYDGGRKILIFVLETGAMICRDVESGKEDWRKILKSGVGHAALCSEGRLLLIENLSKGYDLYELPRSSPVCTYPIPTKKRCVKDGAFAENDDLIVCGSDHGKVYLFALDSSEPIQILHQAGSKADVQAIDTVSTGNGYLIASGISLDPFSVIIWRKRVRAAQTLDSHHRVSFLLSCLVAVFILYGLLAFWTLFPIQVSYPSLIGLDQIWAGLRRLSYPESGTTN